MSADMASENWEVKSQKEGPSRGARRTLMLLGVPEERTPRQLRVSASTALLSCRTCICTRSVEERVGEPLSHCSVQRCE